MFENKHDACMRCFAFHLALVCLASIGCSAQVSQNDVEHVAVTMSANACTIHAFDSSNDVNLTVFNDRLFTFKSRAGAQFNFTEDILIEQNTAFHATATNDSLVLAALSSSSSSSSSSDGTGKNSSAWWFLDVIDGFRDGEFTPFSNATSNATVLLLDTFVDGVPAYACGLSAYECAAGRPGSHGKLMYRLITMVNPGAKVLPVVTLSSSGNATLLSVRAGIRAEQQRKHGAQPGVAGRPQRHRQPAS